MWALLSAGASPRASAASRAIDVPPALSAAAESACLPPQDWYTSLPSSFRRMPSHVADWRWRLPDGTEEFRLSRTAGGSCELTMRDAEGTLLATSGFLRGECPLALAASAPRRVEWKRNGAAAAAFLDGAAARCQYHGNNPSIVRLSDGHALRALVPRAHYLIAMNSYPFWTPSASNHTPREESCPAEPMTTVGLYDRAFEPLLVAPLRRERDLEFGRLSAEEALSDPLEAREESSQNYEGPRPGRSKVTWSQMSDVGIVEHRGRFVATAQDYYAVPPKYPLAQSEFAMSAFVFPLRVEVVTSPGCAPRLYVAHQESQERIFGSCEHQGCDARDIAPHVIGHKNPSLFSEGDELLFLDWIAPTEVGRIAALNSSADAWALPDASEARVCSVDDFKPQGIIKSHSSVEYTQVREMCYERASRTNLTHAATEVFAKLQFELPYKNGSMMLHGGKGLVRLPELGGELLGLGHMARGSFVGEHLPSHYPHLFQSTHYTHFWFTMSAQRPYQLVRVSREFCFRAFAPPHMSEEDINYFSSMNGFVPPLGSLSADGYEHDCEFVQFGSSLLREPSGGSNSSADMIVIGYGAQDAAPLVVEYSVAAVLAMLTPI
ncbi:hypothetical protein AB1Y20_013464 [Prymnesium parvum]|uniref:Uncharacterized protein n=1 Tax=Prymnesium parvum TaxID=97485 RepID=A0AB34IIQ8_PRYPA